MKINEAIAFLMEAEEGTTYVGIDGNDRRYQLTIDDGNIVLTQGYTGTLSVPSDTVWILQDHLPREGDYVRLYPDWFYRVDNNLFWQSHGNWTYLISAMNGSDDTRNLSLRDVIFGRVEPCTRQEIQFLRQGRRPRAYDPRDVLVNVKTGKVHNRVEMKDDFDSEVLIIACFAEDRADGVPAPDMSYLDEYRTPSTE